jgi:hypothetical protein
VGTEARGKIFLPVVGLEPRSPGRPVRSQDIILTELTRLLPIYTYTYSYHNLPRLLIIIKIIQYIRAGYSMPAASLIRANSSNNYRLITTFTFTCRSSMGEIKYMLFNDDVPTSDTM